MLKKLAAGEYPLRTIFWGFGFIGFLFFNLVAVMTKSAAVHSVCGNAGRCASSFVLLVISSFVDLMTRRGIPVAIALHFLVGACFVCYMILVIRGLMKSSKTYEGSPFWSFCAKVMMVFLILVNLKTIL